MKRLLPLALLLTAMTAPVVPDQSAPGAVNPEVTQENLQQTICQPGWSRSVRPSGSFTEALKLRMVRERYPDADPDQFELDHRVPIEDGGCPHCVSNMWLEPWRDPKHHVCQPDVLMDAACKDRLERFVHRELCSGRMTLDQGRTIFLGNWIDAFHIYME